MISHINSSILLLCLTHLLPFVNCVSIFQWRGDIAYFDETTEMSLTGAVKFCSKMGGHLPSVHSYYDIKELTQIIGHNTWIWLGVDPIYRSSFMHPYPNSYVDQYKWTDGTPFDYQIWARSEGPECTELSTCCGVSLLRGKMYSGSCSVLNKPTVCIINQFNSLTVKYLLNKLLENSTKVNNCLQMLKEQPEDVSHVTTEQDLASIWQSLMGQMNSNMNTVNITALQQINLKSIRFNRSNFNAGLAILILIIIVQAVALIVQSKVFPLMWTNVCTYFRARMSTSYSGLLGPRVGRRENIYSASPFNDSFPQNSRGQVTSSPSP